MIKQNVTHFSFICLSQKFLLCHRKLKFITISRFCKFLHMVTTTIDYQTRVVHHCLYIVRFEWDAVVSSSSDGSYERGYTMWCSREGTSAFLNFIWLYLKVVQIQKTWKLLETTFKNWNCMRLNLLRKNQALH